MSATLEIAVHKVMVGAQADFGAVAEILPFKEGGTERHGVLIPVGSLQMARNRVAVEAGRYLVRARLPSGLTLAERVTVAEGQSAKVTFRPEQAAHEWLGWQSLVQEGSARRFRETRARQLSRPHVHVVGWGGADQMMWEEVAEIAKHRWDQFGHLRLWPIFGGTLNRHLEPQFSDREVSSYTVMGYPTERRYAWIQRDTSLDIVALPGEWRLPDHDQAAIEIAVPHDANSAVGTAVRDPNLGALLGFIGGGRLLSAREMLAQDEGPYLAMMMALRRKVQNPFAAAAGAYLLMDSVKERGNIWERWVENLANWFPWLPDGAVLAAILRLRGAVRDDDLAIARRGLETAYDRGIPTYTAILRLMLEGMTLIAEDPDADPGRLREMLPRVRGVARLIDPGQVFTTLQFRGER
jgi:hypothetical protein